MSTAVISECGTYRYRLTRRIPCVLRWVKPCVLIMLNPSTATAETDDPTIRRCISFAASWQCTELIVVNLFALRATDPAELKGHPDPVGPENDRYITEAAEEASAGGVIICAWGVHGGLKDRDHEVVNLLVSKGKQLHCLALSKDGFPRHPLYLKGGLQPMVLP